ncbi:hypothetical protein [Paenibacillus amylolyticus]|nr:hypothetical protein [Paenibacillus amylolyticus]
MDHGGGYMTNYANLSSINSHIGDQVSTGAGWGLSGNNAGNHARKIEQV